MRRHPDQVLLVLIDLILELQLTATARARIGQRDPDLLINTIGHLAVSLGAVLRAALAPRPLRIGLRVTLRERCRLTFACPPRRLKLHPQPRVLRQQPLILSRQPASAHL